MKYQTLPWIAGNPLALRIPLQKVTITADGHETTDYEPQDGDVVTIILRSQRSEKTYVPEIEGNIATISDNGTLLIGEYAVETLVVESDGTKRRSYYPFVLNVMKATPDMLAYFDDFPEYGDGILLDTPSIFFAVGGGTIDAYTKEESDARFVNKVELTAYSTTQQMLAAIAAALNGYATQQYVNGKVQDEATRATGAEQALQTALDIIEAVIPSAASSSNQLADKNFVNSSISTNTATFVGTYNSLAELQAYDDSEVNSFSVNGKVMWLDHDVRQQLRISLDALSQAGRENVTKWFDGVEYTYPIDVWYYMLGLVEVYASDALNVTESHKAAINALDDIEDVEAYQFTGYPEKLSFG